MTYKNLGLRNKTHTQKRRIKKTKTKTSNKEKKQQDFTRDCFCIFFSTLTTRMQSVHKVLNQGKRTPCVCLHQGMIPF